MAVIFSSAVHVVDLGDLVPPPAALPLPVEHEHPHHQHTVHKVVNHTSILQNLMAPLSHLTHLGAAPVTTPAPVS